MMLETDRILLRLYRQEDFTDYCDYIIGDEERGRMMLTDVIRNEEEARESFDWKLNRDSEHWYALCLKKENNKVIGGITVHPVPEELAQHPLLLNKRGVSLSFSISPNYRRRGLMEEAVRALNDHLLHVEGLDYIQCGYMDYNLASRDFQRKLGFTYLCSETFELDGKEYTSIENILVK